MAEGMVRAFAGERAMAWSAGIEPKGLDPRAVRVMSEIGVDITHQGSKTLEALRDLDFDVVVTVCGDARERCPVLPGARRLVHVGFDDPPRLAASARTEEEALRHYRRVRDEIRSFVERLPASLGNKS